MKVLDGSGKRLKKNMNCLETVQNCLKVQVKTFTLATKKKKIKNCLGNFGDVNLEYHPANQNDNEMPENLQSANTVPKENHRYTRNNCSEMQSTHL